VAIDARNDGTFVDCAVAQLPASLGEEWAKSAHLGVSASTGQLADNHDVLSLVPQPSHTRSQLVRRAPFSSSRRGLLQTRKKKNVA
jgi:hypothetical protein